MGFPILVRWYLYIESAPGYQHPWYWQVYLPWGFQLPAPICYTPASMNFKGGYTGFTSFVLSVGLWTESCPLCIFYNTGSILYLHILSSNFRMCVACNVEVEDATSWSQWHSQYSTLQGKPTPSPLSAGGTPSSTPVRGSHHPHPLELVSLAVQHRSGEATTLPYWSWWHSQYSTLQGKPPPSPIGAGGTPSTAPFKGSHHPHLLELVALPVQHPSREATTLTYWTWWHSQLHTRQGKPPPSPFGTGSTPSTAPIRGSHHPHLLDMVALTVQHPSGEATTLTYWSWWHSQYSTRQGKPPPSPIGAGGTPSTAPIRGKPPPSPIGHGGTHSCTPVRGSHHPHLLELVALPVQHPSGEATTLTYWTWWHSQYSTHQGKPPPSPIGAGGTHSTAPVRGSHHPHLLELVALPVQHPSGGSHHPHLLDMVALTVAHPSGEATTLTFWNWWHSQYSTRQGKPPPSPIGAGGTPSTAPVRGSHHPHLLELVALPVQHPSGEATTLTYWSWWHSQYSTLQGKPPPSPIGAGGTQSTAPIRGKPPPSPIGAGGTPSTAPFKGSHHPHLVELVALPVQHPSGGSHHPHLLELVALPVQHPSGEATTLTYWSWWHSQYSTRQGKPPPSPIGAGGTHSTAPVRGSHHPYLLWLICSEARVTKDKCNPIQSSLLHAQHI